MGTDDHVKRPQLNGRSIPTSLSAAASVTDGRTDEESFRNIVAVLSSRVMQRQIFKPWLPSPTLHSVRPKYTVFKQEAQLSHTHCQLDYYPRMPIGKVWIYRSLFLFVCFLLVFVCVCTFTDFSGENKLAASNFALRFIGVLCRESSILGNFAPPEA